MTQRWKNCATFHAHPGSLDTASTPEAFADREVELGTGTLTVTDHGTMASCREVYDLAKKRGLTPIVGLEGYLRDDHCPVLDKFGISTPEAVKEYSKYSHVTINYLDQKAYEVGCRILSEADARAERHGSEYKPIFNWAQLEELGQENVTIGSSCLAGVVQRHLTLERFDIAKAYYEKLRSVVKPGNFFVEVFPHRCDKFWVKGIFLQLEGQTEKTKVWAGKKLRVDIEGESKEIPAEDLARLFLKKNRPKVVLTGRKDNRTMVDLEPHPILFVEDVEGFQTNPCLPWCPDGDIQLNANRIMMMWAKKYGDLIVSSDDSHFARENAKAIQDVRLMSGGGAWRFYGSYHRRSSDESWEYYKSIGVSEAEFGKWIENADQLAGRFKGFDWKPRPSLPTKFYPTDTLKHTLALIKKHGRMDWKNPAMVSRLQSEINLLHNNGTIDLLPYFFLAEEACDQFVRNGRLASPGRGSSGGMLLARLMSITHIDPLKYRLSQDRFMTPIRIKSGKLPDIDLDFPSRDILVDPQNGWLERRFKDCWAQVSTRHMLRLRSSIKDVHRVKHGFVSPEIENICSKIPIPPVGIKDIDFVYGYQNGDGDEIPGIADSDPTLKAYIAKYPTEWELVKGCLALTRSRSRHASAYLVSNDPVKTFIPLTMEEGVPVTAYTAGSVEAVGGLKMDFLVVKCLNDIEKCIRLIQDRSGSELDWASARKVIPNDQPVPSVNLNNEIVPLVRIIPHHGQLFDIWNLPEDQSVFLDICQGRTETVFQFDSASARQYLPFFLDGDGNNTLRSIEHLSAFTALDRPGGLDVYVESARGGKHNMLVEFANRLSGGKPNGDPELVSILQEMLPETLGQITYQEQLTRIYQELGRTSGEAADEFRVHVSKKQMAKVLKDKEAFILGATERFGAEKAEKLWSFLGSWAKYGFNLSHSSAYVTTSYACAYLKHHFPLEWWTSVLSNAERNEVETKFWPHCGHLINTPSLKDSGHDFEIRGEKIQAPLWLLNGVGPTAHEELCEEMPYIDIQDFCNKIEARKVRTGKLNPDTGKLKKGRSALNRTIIAKLIISEAANSLFPPDTDIFTKFNMFQEAEKVATGAKKIKALDAKFTQLGAIERFQLKKSILPSYGMDLTTLYLETADLRPQFLYPKPRKDGKVGLYAQTTKGFGPGLDKEFRCLPGNELEWLLKGLVSVDTPAKVAAVAYIHSTRPFTYHGNKEACEVVIEVDGYRFEMVQWGGKDGLDLPDNLPGSVAAVSFVKWKEDSKWGLSDMEVIQAPLNLKAEESA